MIYLVSEKMGYALSIYYQSTLKINISHLYWDFGRLLGHWWVKTFILFNYIHYIFPFRCMSSDRLNIMEHYLLNHNWCETSKKLLFFMYTNEEFNIYQHISSQMQAKSQILIIYPSNCELKLHFHLLIFHYSYIQVTIRLKAKEKSSSFHYIGALNEEINID